MSWFMILGVQSRGTYDHTDILVLLNAKSTVQVSDVQAPCSCLLTGGVGRLES